MFFLELCCYLQASLGLCTKIAFQHFAGWVCPKQHESLYCIVNVKSEQNKKSTVIEEFRILLLFILLTHHYILLLKFPCPSIMFYPHLDELLIHILSKMFCALYHSYIQMNPIYLINDSMGKFKGQMCQDVKMK